MVEFNIVIEKGEDGYLISEVLEIPGCHTQAKTLDELMKRTKEAIEVCLDSDRESFVPVKIIGMQKIEV